ncbi:MAG: clostripain-related cysteine peptidase [Thermoplasmatota archaeon]
MRRRIPLHPRMTLVMTMMFLATGAMLLIPENGEAQGDDIADWTFMVYLDADNNLESAGIDDMNEMEKVGSTDRVHIVVEMDRIDGYDTTNGDWTGARRFHIERDNDPLNINSPVMEDLGEVNMGDPAELIRFVDWSVRNYPAEKYALVLWDHGGAFRGICFDDTVPGLAEGEYDAINMTDMNYAAEKIYQLAGNRRIDLWGFDACLMAQVAVLYEIKDFAKVGVASGYNEPGDGWAYDPVLEPLVDDPAMDERELAEIIVHEYIRSYEDGAEDPDDYPMVTQAAFDLEKMDEVVFTLDKFAEELGSKGPLGGMEYYTQIYLARTNANSYDMANVFIYDLTGYPLYDVIDFTLELESYIYSAFPKNTHILDLCKEVRTAILGTEQQPGFMFYSEHDRWHPDANGLSMYFPNRETGDQSVTGLPSNYLLSYEETGYAREHLWNEFLHAYYGVDPIEDSLPTISIKQPTFNATVERYDILTISGTAYDREMIDRVEIRIDQGDWRTLPGITGQGYVIWLNQIDISDLEPGIHFIEARARDRPANTDPGTPGHITEPVRTQIYVVDTSTLTDKGFEVPSWAVSALLILIIVAALALGAVVFRGRNG